MDKDLFRFPKKMPKGMKKASAFKTMTSRSFSRRDKEAQKALEKRMKQFTDVFELKSEPIDKGKRLLFKEKDFSFEVFRTSDSVWWTHNELAYREKIPKGVRLPDNEESIDMAKEYLKKFKLHNKFAKVDSVSYTECIISSPDGKKVEEYKTEVHVNLRFFLDEIPVLGSGAKMKVSLVEDGIMSQLLQFWREPDMDKSKETVDLMDPDEALEKFVNQPQFMRLSSKKALVDLEEMDFGYYALPPDEVQRYLLPVYAVKGSVKTEYLEKYDFTKYIVATPITSEKIKRSGIVADPSSCLIF